MVVSYVSLMEDKKMTKLQKSRRFALRRIPKNLNILGFEMAMAINYGIWTGGSRLESLFKEYERVQKLWKKSK